MRNATRDTVGAYSGKPLHTPQERRTRVVRPGYTFRCRTGRMVTGGQTVPAGEPLEGQEHKLMKRAAEPILSDPVPVAPTSVTQAVDEAPVHRAMEGAPKAKAKGAHGPRRKKPS